MIREIVTLSSPNSDILHKVSESVEKVDAEILTLIEEMFDSMYAGNGIGLAAVQIGVPKRIFVADIPEVTPEPLVFINPVIVQKSHDLIEWEEGCLSVPGVNNIVQRPRSIVMEYLDEDGKKQSMVAEEILSVCLQHELDHLDGKLFIERSDKREHKKINEMLEDKGLPRFF